jgi:hypothetical protein
MTKKTASKYSKKHINKARNLYLLGATDQELAEHLGVTRATIYNWKEKYPDFAEVVDQSKKSADAPIAGFVYEQASKDAKVGQWWLERRQRDMFGSVPVVEDTTDVSTPIVVIPAIVQESNTESFDEMAIRIMQESNKMLEEL